MSPRKHKPKPPKKVIPHPVGRLLPPGMRIRSGMRPSPDKVILRMKDGTMVKCSTFSHISAALMNIQVITTEGKVESVPLRSLKAVFFVRDFGGNPERHPEKDFGPGSPKAGKRVKITFEDGEVMRGTAINPSLGRSGFFLFPADPEDNNEKIFIVRTEGIRVEAEEP